MKIQEKATLSIAGLRAVVLTVLIGSFAFCSRAQSSEGDTSTLVLLKSVYRLSVGGQIVAESQKLCAQSDAVASEEIQRAVDENQADLGDKIRRELEASFGTMARDEFGTFVDALSKAEAENDAEFLTRIVESAGNWRQPPTTYAALRQTMVQDVLKADIASAGNFLAEIQTWLDLREKSDHVPNLSEWLNRNNPVQRVVVKSPKPPRKRNSLRDAEAPATAYDGGDDDGSGALESFGSARSERRQKSLENARAGMQQVADERRIAEEEMASKKLAAAQAESEAVRKHAEKLAASETEAIEQRKNSWSGRLKSIVSTTIGATTGAFLGNVGSRAGEAAADAVFNTEK